MPEHTAQPRIRHFWRLLSRVYTRLDSRLKFAVLGALGGAMVLTPLGEVLRVQGAELESLVAERASLDPLAQALTLQHGLLGHRAVADRVLRGRLQLEAERRLRQAEVDANLWALQGTLSVGLWHRALQEHAALAGDWQALAQRVARRQITAPDSAAGHQLLLEQAVQVMDLVSAAAPVGSFAQLLALQAPLGDAVAVTARLQRLAALQAAAGARLFELDARRAQVQAQRAALGSALAALALLAALLAWRARQAWIERAAAQAAAADDIRRGPGRRVGDAPATQPAPHYLFDRLRAEAADTAAEPPASRPGAD